MYYKTCNVKPFRREWTFILLSYTNVEYCFNLHALYSGLMSMLSNLQGRNR